LTAVSAPDAVVRADRLHDPLHVVTALFNPSRYRIRWELYKKFAAMVEDAGGLLWTCEIAFGNRDFVVTRPDHPRHLRLRTDQFLWLKERALNLMIQRLPADWKYVAWIDADVTFSRTDWVNETRHLLQTFDVVQMFKVAEDLDYDFQPFMRHLGFAASYRDGVPKPKLNGAGQYHGDVCVDRGGASMVAWHPGFAWAMRRDAFDTVGGLFDIGITGAGDNHMAKAMLGDGLHSAHPAVSAGYRRAIATWQERARSLGRNMGYVNGLLLHHWHGPKVNRRYWDRWRILTKTGFDPYEDLRLDAQGLYRLAPHRHDLMDLLRRYFNQRNEDAPY
jgi:hypothetical protein